MKRHTLLLLSSFFVVTAVGLADETTKTAKVEEFLRVSHTEALMKQGLEMSMNQLKSGFLQKMVGAKIPQEHNQLLEEFQEKMQAFMIKTLAWESMKADYVKLFSETYTEQQVEDLIAFYRSPTGQAMVAKSPELMMKANSLAQQRMMAAQPELQKLMTDFTDRVRSTAVPPEPK